MRNAGRVVSKTMILSHVWDYNFDPGTNVVDVLVFRLREKIDRDFEPKLLHTVRGIGYVLEGGLIALPTSRRSPLRLRWRRGTPSCSSSASLALVGLDLPAARRVARRARSRHHPLDAARYAPRYAARRPRRAGARGRARAATGAHERLFVRVVGAAPRRCSSTCRREWSDFDVAPRSPAASGAWEQATARRSRRRPARSGVDSSARRHAVPGRQELREPRRAARALPYVALLVSLAIVLIGLAGGIVVTRSTLQPTRRSDGAVRDIIRTGRPDTRVPDARHRDAHRRAERLVNGMLDRIRRSSSGMRGALDNVAHDLRTPLTRLRSIAETRAELGRSRRRSARRCAPASRNPSAIWRCSTR